MVLSKACSLYEKSKELLMGSNECPYDSGGYFILNGNEKVLVAQEKMIRNKVYVFIKKNKDITEINCQCRFNFLI